MTTLDDENARHVLEARTKLALSTIGADPVDVEWDVDKGEGRVAMHVGAHVLREETDGAFAVEVLASEKAEGASVGHYAGIRDAEDALYLTIARERIDKALDESGIQDVDAGAGKRMGGDPCDHDVGGTGGIAA